MKSIEMVTAERLVQRDHYRAQLNIDKELWAFCYNAIAGYYPKTTADQIRNELGAHIENFVRARFSMLTETDPAFAHWLETRYLQQYVAPDIRPRAEKLYRELGVRRARTLL